VICKFEMVLMKEIVLFVVCLVLVSCHSVDKEDIQKLNGYWEIKQVDLPTGDEKEYKVNETIDYFELNGNDGFRLKVMPQFDGKFKTNGIKEQIKISEKNNSFFIEYTTKYGKWNEEIISLEDSTLVVKSKDEVEYTYKKFKPFSFE
jgi:hypothetical protein